MKTTWTTRDGQTLPIKNMDTSHIKNCIKHLKENPFMIGTYNHDGDHDVEYDYDTTKDFIKAFEKELKNRNKEDRAMSKLKWVKPSPENLPPAGVEILCKYKHGIISGYWDEERYREDGAFVWNAYVWQHMEGYIYEFISMDAFNSVFEKGSSE